MKNRTPENYSNPYVNKNVRKFASTIPNTPSKDLQSLRD